VTPVTHLPLSPARGNVVLINGHPWVVCDLQRGEFNAVVIIQRRGLFGIRRRRISFPIGEST
jgi:hypothetical protein